MNHNNVPRWTIISVKLNHNKVQILATDYFKELDILTLCYGSILLQIGTILSKQQFGWTMMNNVEVNPYNDDCDTVWLVWFNFYPKYDLSFTVSMIQVLP